MEKKQKESSNTHLTSRNTKNTLARTSISREKNITNNNSNVILNPDLVTISVDPITSLNKSTNDNRKSSKFPTFRMLDISKY